MHYKDKKTEKFLLSLTQEQKKELKKRADESDKSLTQYLIDSGLETKLDNSRGKFFLRIDSELDKISKDLEYLKRVSYIQTKLIYLLINGKQISDPDLIKEFYNKAADEAEKFFSNESDE